MRLVLDTNVLVSALLHPGRTPDLALQALGAARAVILVDDRVEAEYREVLGRPKFRAIVPARREALLEAVLAGCERVAVVAPSTVSLLDPDDRAFVDVALVGRADAVVTGNGRHYPEGLGFAVLSPAALLARLTGG
jgi:putative PIN family toxin of toxin-antitoxin system